MESRECGKNAIDAGYDSEQIKKAVRQCIEHGKYKPEHIYGEGNSGKKIAEIPVKKSLGNIIRKRLLL